MNRLPLPTHELHEYETSQSTRRLTCGRTSEGPLAARAGEEVMATDDAHDKWVLSSEYTHPALEK